MKLWRGACFVGLILLFGAACVTAEVTSPPAEPTPPSPPTPTITPMPPGEETVLRTASPTPAISPTVAPPFPPQICTQPICTYAVTFPLQRPISEGGNRFVEQSYRYGSTQNGKREVHHGVEFINKAGVPVLAAADGNVVFAGNDDQQSFAAKRDFYGKLIIIQHRFAGIPAAVYTVYGHLLNIEVQTGEVVHAGQKIGEVGLGGVAAGTHLHFEVRFGKNDYSATRNPELWFPPLLEESGVLAGRFFDAQNKPIILENFVLELLEGKTDPAQKRYFSTYQDPLMLDTAPWREGFGITDLPAGKYLLTYIYSHPVQLEFEILPGQVTFLNIRAR